MLRRLLAAFLLAAVPGVASGVEGRSLGAELLRDLDRGVVEPGRIARAAAAGDVRVRLAAVRLLASTADPADVRLLRPFVRDPAVAVRREAQLAAGRMGDPARRAVRRGLGDADGSVRAAAVWAAAQLGAPPPRRLQRLARREHDPRVLRALAACLWRWPEPWRRPLAERLVETGSAGVLAALASGAARSGSLHPLLHSLAGHRSDAVRAPAVLGLARGRAVAGDRDVAMRAVADEEASVRVAALTVLAARPGWRLSPAQGREVTALLDDAAPHVRVMAIRALGHHPEVAAGSRLVSAADGPDPWPAAEALLALARRGDPAAPQRVEAWLGADTRWRREAAARCAGAAPELFARLLDRVLADPEPAVRLAWIEGASEGPSPDPATLRRLLEDPDPAVRAAALHLLAEAHAPPLQRLLELAHSWQGDILPDARAEALVRGIERAADPAVRRRILGLAAADPSPVVGTLVADAARRLGLAAHAPPRPAGPMELYRELWKGPGTPLFLDLVTVRGTVRLRLETERAPITCRRIWELARSGFYDGLTFHRVVPDFVVQGGDPRGDGWGSGGLQLPDEPSLASFGPGVVGIATSGPNTGGCQLFAMLLDAPHLVGRYTRFATVVAGAEVLPRIRRWDAIRRVVCRKGRDLPPVTPVLVGPVTPREVLAVPGWRKRYREYTPDPGAVERLRKALSRGAALRVTVVLGTWCSDSRREVPRLLKIVHELGDGAGVTLELEGVDRTLVVEDPAWDPVVLPGRRPRAVPTIVVMGPGGEELARVVETSTEPLERVLARAAEEVVP